MSRFAKTSNARPQYFNPTLASPVGLFLLPEGKDTLWPWRTWSISRNVADSPEVDISSKAPPVERDSVALRFVKTGLKESWG
eukprot:3423772-Rhodomonas_salina.2